MEQALSATDEQLSMSTMWVNGMSSLLEETLPTIQSTSSFTFQATQDLDSVVIQSKEHRVS